MEICSKKDIKFITGVMAASVLLGGCTANINTNSNVLKEDPNAKTSINLNEVTTTDFDQAEMDKLYREYCFNILSQTVKDYGSEDNVMISPASIMIALDMVAAGAKGESLDQLTNLFAAGKGPLTQQAYASALMDKINEAEDVEFSCANAVWANKTLLGNAVNLDYVQYIQDTFNADYRVQEFGDKTVNEINGWVDDHTDHMIKEVISDLSSETVMVLVNAISFDGDWADPYEEDQVKEGEFTKYNGEVQTVKFLHETGSSYYETEKATGFLKAYEGGQYGFLAILPSDETISANEFVKNFSAEDYEEFIASQTYDYSVYTMIPEFESDFEMEMGNTLANLGAGDIMDGATSDLSGIAGAPGDLFVSKVLHKTHIEVDAEGTRAAAVTAVLVDGNCAEPIQQEFRSVECDRPFAYAIVDMSTMTPIFIGTVNAV